MDNLCKEKIFQSIDQVLVLEELRKLQKTNKHACIQINLSHWIHLLTGSACGNTLAFLGRISFHGGIYSGGGGGSNGRSRIQVSNIDVENVSFKL